VKLRTRSEALKNLTTRHPEWKDKFLKYKVPDKSRLLSPQKIKLLFLIFTEGCVCKNKIQFTNNHAVLRDYFSMLMREVYDVDTKTDGNVAYIFSREIAKDFQSCGIKKIIPDKIMHELLKSPSLTKEVLRLFADTEGAVLISIRKAPQNYTVADRRIVIACTNEIVKAQLITLLESLGIKAHLGKDGIFITYEHLLRIFALQVGFSSGIKVVRKRAGHGIWYGYEKATLLRLVARIYDEQIKRGRGYGEHEGVFRNCKKADDVMKTLRVWYNESRGEEA